MRRIRPAALYALLGLLISQAAHAETPALIRTISISGTGLQSAYVLAARSSNVWVSGTNMGTMTLGGNNYAVPLNVYIAMFGTDGSYQWSHAFNTGGGIPNGIGVDTANNVYLTGQFSGTVNFGGSNLVAAGPYDMFLVKFNATGVHQWSKQFGDVGNGDAPLALVIDNANNVIIGGQFNGTTNFGGGPLTTAGSSDAFIAKFNSAGTHVWSKQFGDASAQVVNGLASVNGDVYATGAFQGGINLGGSTLTSSGNNDVFMAKFNSAGAHQWSQRYGDSSIQSGVDIDVDASGVYLLANIQGSINFGGSFLTSAGSQDVAVARFSTAGVHSWSRSYGDQDAQTATALDLSGGSLFVGGYFEGTINFGQHRLTAFNSGPNAFLANLRSTDGAETWAGGFGYNFNSDFLSDVAALGSQVFCSGHFQNDIDFGYNGTLTSQERGFEAYVALFGQLSEQPVIREVDDVANDQGGKVRVRVQRSDYDAIISPLAIRNYEVYLREDPLSLNAARKAGTADNDTWILAGQVPAHAVSEYYTLASSQQDSTLALGHTSVYKVRATTDDPGVYFDSNPVGGQSLDNLAPAVPLNFTIENNELSWVAPGDGDVDYYSVYGSAGAFDAAAVLIDYTTATRLDVSGRQFTHYFVTATDRAGNESAPASLDGTRAAPPLPPRTLSVSAYPNPFNPATTVRYTLPSAGRVRVAIYAASGAHVRTLVDRDSPAGAFTARWDGNDDTGAAAATGVYFARIQHAGATRAYKLVMLK